MRKFTYDIFDTIAPPTLILSTKYHKHIGNLVNVQNIANEFNMASHQEISFDVYKEVDGVKCELWDQIVDFKYLYVPEHNEYYELQVDIDETNMTVKHCVGVSASECELSQKYLRDFHVNDETDILRDDYVVTVFYNPHNPEGSLLDRVLHDKGQSWTIEHVDSSIAGIQRTFTADGSTIYDFLMNDVAKEIGCLFLFNSVNRTISAYDLKSKCNNVECGFRGEFVDYCPKCGTTNFTKGYGTYQNVFVASENFANQITVDGDADNVKNCFKIAGGDDLITATVANLNPNRSNYIYRFSDDMLSDMPSELVAKLDTYNQLYNELLPTYQGYTDDYYEAVDQELYYHTKMMPDTPMPTDTTAALELSKLMNQTYTVAVQNLVSVSKASADLAVQGYAKALIDPRYTVEVFDSTLSDISGITRTWKGKFKVTSLGKVDDQGNPDEAKSNTYKTITVNGNYEEFLQQKIQKSLDRKDAAFTTIFNIELDSDFKRELKEYSLDRLTSFANTYQSVLEILIQQGVADVRATDDLYRIELYNSVYLPYYNRKGFIEDEMVIRQAEVDAAKADIDEANKQRRIIQNQLDLKKYLGDELYEIFTLYLREDTYTNSNYISDGLDNGEVIQKAQELFTVAESELYKASELQYSLSGTLANFLNTEEFKDVKGKFEIGDWILCKADDRLYRLRLINLGYSYDSPADMQVTFSNATRINNSVSDMMDLLNKAESVATSYDYTAHQAEQGKKAQDTMSEFLKLGLDSSLYNIMSGANQEVVIDEHGITAKEFVDTLDDYSPEQLKITNNILAFTDDNWKTASLGLGKHLYRHYDESTNTWITEEGYGLSAKFVNAGYINGSVMSGGHIYSENYDSVNNIGTHIDLLNGTFNFAGQGFVYNGEDLTLGGFTVATDSIMTNNISIYADGRIISDYLVGKVDETEGADYHGEIFNTYDTGSYPWAKHQKIDMDNFTEFLEGNIDVKPTSAEENNIVWIDDGNNAYCTFYYNTARDITNWNYLSYLINVGNIQSGATLRIALLDTPPTRYDQLVFYDLVIDEGNKEYKGGISLSNKTGYKYIVISATGGLNATIKKLQLANFIGQINKATGVATHAEGCGTTASNEAAHSEGYGTGAHGRYSHAEGQNTMATSTAAHSEGINTGAYGDYSHAEGSNTLSTSLGSHAEGDSTRAVANYSHAEGSGAVASGFVAHAEGNGTQANGEGSHAEGVLTYSNGRGSHAEGVSTKAQNGDGVHVEGAYCVVNFSSSQGSGAHAEGNSTQCLAGTGAHTEGSQTKAYCEAGHAEGFGCEVGTSEQSSNAATAAHAEGAQTKAIAYASHAEGASSRANGHGSHAEGGTTFSNGMFSHTEGYNTLTGNDAWYSHAEGEYTRVNGVASHSEGGYYYDTQTYNYYYTTANGYGSHAEGEATVSSGRASHAEGGCFKSGDYVTTTTASGNYSHAEGQGTTASGIASHSEGYGGVANSNYAHKEGYFSNAVAEAAHAEGRSTATGAYSHSEGMYTTTVGMYSHAEGYSNVAVGVQSHVEGTGNTANGRSQHVIGEYCITDSLIPNSNKGNYIMIVGNGSDTDHRSNAYTLDWDGNGTYAGTVTVGANPTQPMHLATKQYVDGLLGNDFTGATASSDGTHGLVPAPLIADKDKYLKGDGTWATVEVGSSVSVNPIVTTGTKIAEVTIDGNTESLYAPVSGSSVIPNPPESPTDTLNSVSIEGTVYGILSGALYGTTAPTSDMGVNGAIYVQYDATENEIKYVYCKINGTWMLFPFAYDNDTFVDDTGDKIETDDGDTLIFIDGE